MDQRPMTTRRRHMTRLMAAGLALGLLASSLGTAHAQAPATTLLVRDRAAFLAVWPAVQRCSAGLTTVDDDLQQASGNFSAGSTETGSLGDDASGMRDDCLAADHRVYSLRFAPGARHAAARRVKAELYAALVDLAQGADDCARIPDDVASGDYSSALGLIHDGEKAWGAATAHMRVATSYVK